jgi:hypothetical protein
MPTKLILSIAAFVLGLPGLCLLFAPDVALAYFGSAADPAALLFTQLAGGFAVAIGINNWMARGAAIGGIYGRPLLMADLCTCFTAGLGLLKAPDPLAGHPVVITVAVLLLACGVAFGRLLFSSPNT